MMESGHDIGPNPKLKVNIKKGPITKGEIIKETIKGLPEATGRVMRTIGRGIGLSGMRRPSAAKAIKKSNK